jgi:hypothetical protein
MACAKLALWWVLGLAHTQTWTTNTTGGEGEPTPFSHTRQTR